MEKINYKNYDIEISEDENPMNPRKEFDNIGTMICFHSRYNLGDVKESKIFNDNEEFLNSLMDGLYESESIKEIIDKLKENIIILPLYLYDHSGITMNTTGFSCRFDSGQVGWIYCTKEKLIESEISEKEWYEKGKEILEYEVEIYSQYIEGDIYQYKIIKADDIFSHCGGFYGSNHEKSGLLSEAKSEIDLIINNQ